MNHKDGNRSNNHFNNLAWVTFQENSEHSLGIKIDKLDLYGNWLATYASMTLAAESIRAIPTCIPGISSCCSKRQKTAYGFKWQFAV